MKIPVRAASHQYEVVSGSGILKEAFESYRELFETADQVIVLTDEHVWAAQGGYFTSSCPYPFHEWIMPAGEIFMQHILFYWRKNVHVNR